MQTTPQLIEPNKPVYVYYNSHKHKWSIRQNGKVKTHLDVVVLKNAKFTVSKAGRLRSLAQNRKNVHAGITGIIRSWKSVYVRPDTELKEVVYNREINSHFVFADTGNKITNANAVFMVALPKSKLFNVYAIGGN